jgi:hypothetical protein
MCESTSVTTACGAPAAAATSLEPVAQKGAALNRGQRSTRDGTMRPHVRDRARTRSSRSAMVGAGPAGRALKSWARGRQPTRSVPSATRVAAARFLDQSTRASDPRRGRGRLIGSVGARGSTVGLVRGLFS